MNNKYKVSPTSISMIFFILLLSSCKNQIFTTGTSLSENDLQMLNKNSLSSSEIKAKLGNPTIVPYANDKTWYYVGTTYKKRLISKPLIIEQKIVPIEFEGDKSKLPVEIHTNQHIKLNRLSRNTVSPAHKISRIEHFIKYLGKSSIRPAI